MASKVINISLPEELLSEVDRMTQQEKRSRSEFFREAVRRYLKEITDRQAFAALSVATFNRIWDNPSDAKLWDDWERQRAPKV